MSPEETTDVAKPRKKIKVFVNTDSETDVEIHEWKINIIENENKDIIDHSRVDVQTEQLCYSIILDSMEPKIETWEVNSLGQLGKAPLATVGLPFIEDEE